MKLSKLAAMGAVSIASSAWAGGKVPPGWMEVANSLRDFGETQPSAGWRYLFDRGSGTLVEPMVRATWPGFDPNMSHTSWAATGVAGCGGETVCMIGRVTITGTSHLFVHGNTGGNCCTSGAGVLQPRIVWTSPIALRTRIEWTGRYAVLGDQPVQLLVNGALLYEANDLDFGTDGQTLSFDVASASEFEMRYFRCSPFDFNLRILTPDCNANLIPDAVEIASGSAQDSNQDGVPDSCQCFGDVIENGVVDGSDLAAVLTTWGTDGGIYPRADTNSDGVVDGVDLATVLGSWGSCR